MRFKADEIASVIQKEIEDFRGQIETSEVGRVLEVGDGIARVYGLAGAMAGEMVEFPSGVRGQVFNLEENSVGVIILGDYLKIAEGDEVKSTGTGAFDLVAFGDLQVIAQDDHADRILFEIEDLPAHAAGKFNHFAGHGPGQAVDARDAVADFEHAPDFAGLDRSSKVFNLFLKN